MVNRYQSEGARKSKMLDMRLNHGLRNKTCGLPRDCLPLFFHPQARALDAQAVGDLFAPLSTRHAVD